MLTDTTINQRLEDMLRQSDTSNLHWPENCEGSRKALVVFVGPSPGGKKGDKHNPIKLQHYKPLWNVAYVDPLNWSNGFKASFRPIVETIIGRPYEDAAKLIARFNMDWQQNPESQDVLYRYMWEGCLHVLPVLYECAPELVIPMDEKTFGVLQIALYNDDYEIIQPRIGEIRVKISDKNEKPRYHESIMAFRAEKKASSFLVIKSLQHPARVYDAEYARRIGRAIKIASEQIWNGDAVNLDV